ADVSDVLDHRVVVRRAGGDPTDGFHHEGARRRRPGRVVAHYRGTWCPVDVRVTGAAAEPGGAWPPEVDHGADRASCRCRRRRGAWAVVLGGQGRARPRGGAVLQLWRHRGASPVRDRWHDRVEGNVGTYRAR